MKEMKLMDLAKIVWEMKVGNIIDFTEGTEMDAEAYGGWICIKRIDFCDNDNPMFIVSYYGGEANAVLYHLSEYDPRIGDFCQPRLRFRWKESQPESRTEINWIECCAKMLADYLDANGGGVPETITVDV